MFFLSHAKIWGGSFLIGTRYWLKGIQLERRLKRALRQPNFPQDKPGQLVDFQRQFLRGTLVPPSIMWAAEAPAAKAAAISLDRPIKAANDRYNYIKGITILVGCVAIYDYFDSRPIIWC